MKKKEVEPSNGHRIWYLWVLIVALSIPLFAERVTQLLDYGKTLPPQLLDLHKKIPALWVDQQPSYEIQVFNQDPMILYIKDFLSKSEIEHILNEAEGKYEESRLWPDEIGYVDYEVRVSESATIDRTEIVRNVERRARKIMGWRNNSTFLQPLKTQRYRPNGFYNFHYDWDEGSEEGQRVTTFMVFLADNCTGGGTNFPRLKRPEDPRWCDVIECREESDELYYPGVTFKPIAGSAVYWENLHPNGSGHHGTRHAGLPVATGEKIGMNIWSWDVSWRKADHPDTWA